MAFTEGYLGRLAAWVKKEKDLHGFSNESFAAAVNQAARATKTRANITHAAIYKWENQSLKAGLRQQSIAAIAAYRNESFEKTKAWLEGRPFVEPEPSLQERVEKLETEVELLKGELGKLTGKRTRATPHADRFAKLVEAWRNQFDSKDRKLHLKVFDLTEADLEEIGAGRPVSEQELKALLWLLGEEVQEIVRVRSSTSDRSAQLTIQRQISTLID